ncbi:LOW QUALITY PROTEIN: hypothetical protein TorRG33x02_076870 [Trema orientale]|uniref:Uncharacterized protein n=1 Tax=Trema orientale TaxID=63057 RepID=A0A2P5FF65_TREOI|nr:LOW QUALITY PROTEIN: hypothetical protein TorRG33x02_076870 [Trema orientale]
MGESGARCELETAAAGHVQSAVPAGPFREPEPSPHRLPAKHFRRRLASRLPRRWLLPSQQKMHPHQASRSSPSRADRSRVTKMLTAEEHPRSLAIPPLDQRPFPNSTSLSPFHTNQ